ncbi:histidine kinase [Sinomonas sp. ASV322]|uniref:sensor histidine kinase n=1 Tax=Sinomonas sp. ASV322 TaxID=3041920 RepID=UPI0027DD3162|nr:histidine kinase [Sinomonas sp. ASV322]MDQ4501356.1 histidine kinase [Sinomonas sp. ASV322]
MTSLRAATRRRIWLAAAALSLAWAVGGAAIGAGHGWGGDHLLEFLSCLAFLLSGLFAIHRRSGNPIGVLLVVYGFVFYLGFWASLFPPVLEALSAVAVGAANALLVHIAVIYPTGRAVARFGRVLTFAVYTWNITLYAALEVTLDRSPWQCDASHYCRATLSLWLWPSADIERTVWTLLNASTPIIVALIALALRQRWRLSSVAERAGLRPSWIALVVLGGATSVKAVGGLIHLSDMWARTLADLQVLAQLAAPIVIVYGLVHSQLAELARRNAELAETVQAQLLEVRASRARIVAAGDTERRRVERDLHDGAQQRLLSVIVALRAAERKALAGSPGTAAMIAQAGDELRAAIEELRAIARGIHPSILTDAGLGPAVRALADRSPIPVGDLQVPAGRLPPTIEVTAYFVVAEALANAAKHAQAATVAIRVERNAGLLHVVVSDDGVGGAAFARGSGLRGLADRVAAVSGGLDVVSAPGAGTVIRATIPLAEAVRA